MIKICANMIVKNEACRIEKCLKSLLPFVDCFVICDTGSNDGTQDVIYKFLSKENAKFNICQTTFKTWDQARNDAMDCARKLHPESDYLLFIDADMELIIDGFGTFNTLDMDAYTVRQDNSSLSYYNIRLVKNNSDAKYVGVTHEYISISGKIGTIDWCHFNDSANGSNRSVKMERDEKLLRGELSNGLHLRYMFYLANTLRESGNYHEAIKWYEARISSGGWGQEVWLSMYYAGVCCGLIKNEGDFLRWMTAAITMNPKRSEPWVAMSEHFRTTESFDLSYVLARHAALIKPPKDSLFIDKPAHSYKPFFEVSLSGFYAQSGTGKLDAKQASYLLTTMKDVPRNIALINKRNIVFHIDKIESFFRGSRLFDCSFGISSGAFGEHNPSICDNKDGGFDLIVRSSNYRWKNDGPMVCEILDGSGLVKSENYLIKMDSSMNVVSKSKLDFSSVPVPPFESTVSGYEDLRVFRCNGELYAIAMSRRYNALYARQILIKIGDNGIVSSVRLIDFGQNVHEKNWIPINGMNKITFLYKCQPNKILEIENSGDLRIIDGGISKIEMGDWSGGSPAIRVEDGWLFVIHESVSFDNKPRVYWHRFVWMNDNFEINRYTDPFIFSKVGIEYCTGLILIGEKYLLTLGVDDRKIMFCEVPRSSLAERWKTA